MPRLFWMWRSGWNLTRFKRVSQQFQSMFMLASERHDKRVCTDQQQPYTNNGLTITSRQKRATPNQPEMGAPSGLRMGLSPSALQPPPRLLDQPILPEEPSATAI